MTEHLTETQIIEDRIVAALATIRREWGHMLPTAAPGVEVSVSFDLHDHQVALNLLDVAVREVKAQIEETRGDVIERNRAAIDEEIREAHTIVRRKETP